DVHHPEVAPAYEVAVDVEHVGDAARHAGGEVTPARPQHDDPTARHVLARVVAHALDDRVHAAVAYAEPLAGDAPHVRFAAGGAVERDVADHDVLFRHEGRRAGRIDDELAAREPLAPVVVGVALEREADAPRHERAERLARGAGEVDADRVVSQPAAAPPLGDVVAEHRADRAVDVPDRQPKLDRLAVLD